MNYYDEERLRQLEKEVSRLKFEVTLLLVWMTVKALKELLA